MSVRRAIEQARGRSAASDPLRAAPLSLTSGVLTTGEECCRTVRLSIT